MDEVIESLDAQLSVARQAVGFALAVIGVPVLTLAASPLHPSLSLGGVLLILLAVVLCVAWVGGRGPGLLATAVAATAADLLWAEPRYTLRVAHRPELIALIVFLVLGATASVATSTLRRRTSALVRAKTEARALSQANDLRGAILSAVSHDLRTPIATIKAAATSLMTEIAWSGEDRLSFATEIDVQADRLDGIVTNLLDMSRMQAGIVRPRFQDVSLIEVIRAATRTLDEGERVDLDAVAAAVMIWTDPHLLERALANVMANALAWSERGQPVEVVVSTDRETATVRIVDQGPGIAAADRDRVFEPFQRLGDAGRTSHNGVGLGLAVARGLTVAVDGQLEIEDCSTGATFLFTLPVAS